MAYNTHNTGIQYNGNDYEGKGMYSILENEALRDDYHNNLQNSYSAKDKSENPFGQDYHRTNEEENKDNKEKEENKIIEEEEIKKKYEKNDSNSEEVKKKQTELEIPQEIIIGAKDRKDSKTIEDAIKNAIKQEQSLIVRE